MTNREKINTMSDEELGDFICKHFNLWCGRCPAIADCWPGHDGIAAWLKKEADE